MAGAPLEAHYLAEMASVLAVGLSEGRRRRARLVTGPGRRFGTDLRTIFVPSPPPHLDAGLRGATCGLALQSASTKEAVARLPLEDLGRRELRALAWAEGEAALGWVGRHWPALAKDLIGLLSEVEIGDPDADGPTLLEQAVRRARSKTPLSEPPPLLGVLPRAEPVIAQKLLRPQGHASRRMPWSMRQTETRKKRTRIALGGRGGDNATSGSIGVIEPDDDITWQSRRIGLPYDEWNLHTQQYRKGFVTVLEFPTPTLKSPPHPTPPDVAAWFRWSPDRMWLRGREDGTEVDLEAYVDEYCRLFAGEAVENRIYADIGDAPRDVATAVLLDASGSLDAQAGRSLALELSCADALASAMSETREPHAIFSFTGDTRHRVEVRVLRDFADQQPRLPSQAGVRPGGYTRLGAPLRHVTRRLLEAPAQRRILLALGDGLPCDEGYEGPYAEADVAKAVEEAVDHGITIFYLGVGSVRRDPLPAMFGAGRFLRLRRLSDLPEALAVTHEGLRQQ